MSLETRAVSGFNGLQARVKALEDAVNSGQALKDSNSLWSDYGIRLPFDSTKPIPDEARYDVVADSRASAFSGLAFP